MSTSEFLRGRNLERANNAEAEELGVGHIPDAFRQLRILLFPRWVRMTSCRAPQFVGSVIPGPAPGNVRIRRGRPDPRRHGERVLEPVIGRLILVQTPLGHVAMHVIQSPWIRLLLADLLVLEV